MTAIQGLFITPSESPYKSNGRAIHSAWFMPSSSYIKAFVAFSNSAGSAKDSYTVWVSDTPPYTITGGTIDISYAYPANTGYFETITYNWVAW